MSSGSFEDRYFQSRELILHYLDWSNDRATSFLILHHVGSQAHTWDHLASRMVSDDQVLGLDLRGHGESQWACEGYYTTEHYALDVAALVNYPSLERVIVLGGSLGGRVALVLLPSSLSAWRR